jgi:hypothetical protein
MATMVSGLLAWMRDAVLLSGATIADSMVGTVQFVDSTLAVGSASAGPPESKANANPAAQRLMLEAAVTGALFGWFQQVFSRDIRRLWRRD